MHTARRIAAAAAGAGLALSAGLLVAPPATGTELGDTPLAALLLADGDTFDHNPYDYDVLTEAALAVLANDPSSPVGLLTDGSVQLTAFLPTDFAFAKTVRDLTGSLPESEEETFEIVAGLGLDTVESVLLYHVIPGAPVDSATVVQSDGAVLTTAAGPTLTVDVFVKPKTGNTGIRLIDGARPYPWLVLDRLDINAGNNQIAHRIGRVLLP
jgi:hypothetical protein